MTDTSDPNRSADLAAYSVMRAVLPARSEGTEATRSDVRRIVDDLEQRLGHDAVVTLVGSLALTGHQLLVARASNHARSPHHDA